jgi:2-iminobutanoate/2-iminopropanoate deaminase
VVRFQLVQSAETKPAGGRPYSPALRAGDWLVVAGQAPVDTEGNAVGCGDAAAQWRQCLENLRSLVTAAGGSLDDVLHLGIYVTKMRHHLEHNEIRREFFTEPYPTATVVAVTALADPDWLIEIEALAYLGDGG